MGTANLTGITFNTKAGATIGNGGLQSVLDLEPDFVLLQELRSASAVRRVATPDQWRLFTRKGPGDKTGILTRNARLEWLGGSNKLISAGPDLGLRPARYRNTARYQDLETGRLVWLHNVHTWTVGKLFETNNKIRRGHEQQIAAVADACARRPADAVVIAGGDFNQKIDKPLPPSARHIEARRMMSAAGMESTGGLIGMALMRTVPDAAVDEVFVRPADFVEVAARSVFKVGFGADHKAVRIDLLVTSA